MQDDDNAGGKFSEGGAAAGDVVNDSQDDDNAGGQFTEPDATATPLTRAPTAPAR